MPLALNETIFIFFGLTDFAAATRHHRYGAPRSRESHDQRYYIFGVSFVLDAVKIPTNAILPT